MAKFVVPDITGEAIMDIAKILASSPEPLSKSSLYDSFPTDVSQAYVNRAITATCRLGLAAESSSGLEIAQKYRDNIKRLSRSELYIALAQALTDYPPFMLYADLINKGYVSTEAAKITRGVLNVATGTQIVERSLRLWGLYSKTLEFNEKERSVQISFKVDRLAPELVKKLEEAVRD